MKHLSPQICKRLEAMGLVSESGMWWNQIKLALLTSPEKYELSSIPPLEKYGAYSPFKFFPAFTISDILLSADNARKLWGEATTGWVANPEEKEWQYQSHRLLDLVLSGTDIEPELQKAIESKPL